MLDYFNSHKASGPIRARQAHTMSRMNGMDIHGDSVVITVSLVLIRQYGIQRNLWRLLYGEFSKIYFHDSFTSAVHSRHRIAWIF